LSAPVAQVPVVVQRPLLCWTPTLQLCVLQEVLVA